MDLPPVTEDDLDLAYEALSNPEREGAFGADAGLVVLAAELSEWLEDDRQWVSAVGANWVSLIDDLSAALRARGDATRHYFEEQAGFAWVDLRACRSLLREKSKRAPDPALRRRLARAAAAISASLGDPRCLRAAWIDLLGAREHADAAAEARWLLAIARLRGQDPGGLATYLRRILDDEKVAVSFARGEPKPRFDRSERAGATPAERVELVAGELQKPARRAQMVVWLRYALADIGPEKLEVGDSLTFYKRSWIAERFEEKRREELPVELRAVDPYADGVQRLAEAEYERGSKERDADALPYVLVRVALGEVEVEKAVELARETAEIMVSLATLHGSDPTIWLLADDYVTFSEEKQGASARNTPKAIAATLEQRTAISRDLMPEVFAIWAEKLAPNLPLRREDLRRAAQLALWLRRARETWEPGRLVLCDRVFEQVAGWAGVVDRRQFLRAYLRPAWALNRIRLEVRNCWAAITPAASIFHRPVSEEAWAEIEALPELGYEAIGEGWSVNLRGVSLNLDFLIERIEDGPERERFARLRRRFVSGKALGAWVNELYEDFDVFEKRTTRVRNSLIHGGPLSEETARSVLTYVDWIASEALDFSIRGILEGEDLIESFLDRRQAYERSIAALRQGADPREAFHWGD